MMLRCHLPTRRNCRALFVLLIALTAAIAGCASGGKRGWFSKEPDPPRTIADFMKQPRPK